MPYYTSARRFQRRGLGLPPLNSDGSAPLASTALVAGAAGACPGSPGCPGYQVTLQDLQNLPLVGTPSPATTAQLALLASSLNPNLPTGSTFTDWLNAHASAALWIGGIAAGILLFSRL